MSLSTAHSIVQPIVLALIAQKREGSYWDFKAEHHSDNGSLLHDILCMANTLYLGSKYIIFGVSDPAKGCELIGLKNSPCQPSQAEIISFLSSIQFSQNRRPSILLHNLDIDGFAIDVLEVMDKPEKPYFLESRYKKVHQYQIYTREGDTNTPVNSQAPEHVIEKMWRERFGLDTPPLERLALLLKDHGGWHFNIDIDKQGYYKTHPEFHFEIEGFEPYDEPFRLAYLNPKSFYAAIKFKYHSTVISENTIVLLDEMRLPISEPDRGSMDFGFGCQSYSYFIKDSLAGALLSFLTQGTYNTKSRTNVTWGFVIYESETERKAFEQYLASTMESPEYNDDQFPHIGSYRLESEVNKSRFIEGWQVQEFFKRHYKIWKNQNMPVTQLPS